MTLNRILLCSWPKHFADSHIGGGEDTLVSISAAMRSSLRVAHPRQVVSSGEAQPLVLVNHRRRRPPEEPEIVRTCAATSPIRVDRPAGPCPDRWRGGGHHQRRDGRAPTAPRGTCRQHAGSHAGRIARRALSPTRGLGRLHRGAPKPRQWAAPCARPTAPAPFPRACPTWRSPTWSSWRLPSSPALHGRQVPHLPFITAETEEQTVAHHRHLTAAWCLT